jgi:superfamily II DNA or RNA helicase
MESFEFFNFDFDKAMSMLGKQGIFNKIKLRDEICGNNESRKKETLKLINYHSANFIRSIQNRKKFVQEHPAKIQIAEEIIKARSDQKIITFSANTKVAQSFSTGLLYAGKNGKKNNENILKQFAESESGVLNSIKLAEEGMNLPDLSIGIMLGVNSSKTKALQSLGRVIRLSENKTAEFFTLVINDTIETEWMSKSRSDDNFTIIDVDNLRKYLNGESWEPYFKKIKNYTFRF